MGIPFCSHYKYLGTMLDCKLTLKPQLERIQRKAGHLYTKLFPYLIKTSTGGRKDAFCTFVLPLFRAASLLLETEEAMVHKKSLDLLKKKYFKMFIRTSKRMQTILMDDMLGRDLELMARAEANVADAKWEARKRNELASTDRSGDSRDFLRGVHNN